MKSKTKFKIIKSVSFFVIPMFFFLVSVAFAVFGASELWGNMFDKGIDSFAQWITLILYRFLVYILPAIILSFFVFDKRYSFSSRLIIWFNWSFFIYLLIYAIINIFALNLVFNIELFSTLDAIMILLGYVFTYIKKKPVEFDKVETIIDNKP